MPPTYNEAISVPPVQPQDVQQKQHKAPQDYQLPIPDEINDTSVKFTDMAQHVTCQRCSVEVKTQVTSEVSGSGWAFAIICCLCGSCLLSCLVKCFPGFRRYTHSCPECGAIIARAEPKHETPHLFAIGFFSMITIIFIVLEILFSLE